MIITTVITIITTTSATNTLVSEDIESQEAARSIDALKVVVETITSSTGSYAAVMGQFFFHGSLDWGKSIAVILW
jgi:hypothetical protein